MLNHMVLFLCMLLLSISLVGTPILALIFLLTLIINSDGNKQIVTGTAALMAALALMGGILGMVTGKRLRILQFEGLAHRSQSLVGAIHLYTEEKGNPPGDLKSLVPEYIDQIPGTGMRNHPDYEYRIVDDPKHYNGNPWILTVNCGFGMSFDQFIYLPKENYPAYGYGGGLEPVANWAYVHE